MSRQPLTSRHPRTSRYLIRTLAVVAVLTGLLLPTAAYAAEGPDSSRIDAWIAERMDAHGIPGAAVAVVRGGETIHLRGYGTAGPDGRPVTADTPFLIGSVSKPFTAHVVRELVDEGRLSLDEPVLPHLAHLVDDPPSGFDDVTVEHLLTHTAGIDRLVGLPGTVTVHTTPDALQRRVRDVLSHPLAAAPGERYEYSNAGYVLLAAVVEEVTANSFADVVRERILDPLDMDDTFATDAHPAAARMATGHRLWFDRWRPADLPFDPAGIAYGYLGSSAQDLARFLHAHLDDDTPLVPASASELAADPVVPSGWDAPLERNQGMGWMRDELAGHQVVSHAGSLEHFTTHLIMVPEADGLGIAVTTNASAFIVTPHEGQYDLSLGLTRMLLDLEPEPAGRSQLVAVGVPVLVWMLAALIVVAAVRHLVRTLPRWRRESGPVGARGWVLRLVLPAIGYAALSVGLAIGLPLGVVRHFGPDIGWGVSVLAGLAGTWAVLRTVVTAAALWPADTSAAEHPHHHRSPSGAVPREPARTR